ncbi:ATPase/DNA helicase [Scheffersomyces xylosifermentans]|uniref:ATPase/DNA helicase n=1 Tax=Scheffersomyces xylosifermentans TaxID=1304137 RepID=UPI00315C65A7
MTIVKQRFFKPVPKEEPPKNLEVATTQLASSSSTSTASPEACLFVADDEEDEENADDDATGNTTISTIAVTNTHTSESSKTSSNIPSQVISSSHSNESEEDLGRGLLESQINATVGHVSPHIVTYLFKKYYKQPNFVRMAINEYLKGINPEDMQNYLAEEQREIDKKRSFTDTNVSSEIDLLFGRMQSEAAKQKDDKEKLQWSRYIGSVDVQAWATRPTMQPLQYSEKLTIKRLIPRKSNMNNSSIIRLCTAPKSPTDSGREIGRIPEDLTRIFSPLIDLEIAIFEATVLETTKRRLSTGDSFIIQIDISLKDTAFKFISSENDSSQDPSSFKRQRTQATKTGFNFAAETEDEATLRLRQYALSRLFERLEIKPTRTLEIPPPNVKEDPHSEIDASFSIAPTTQDEPISLDSDSEIDEDAEQVKPIDSVNLDQLKEFYQANNQSKLLDSLPVTTTPPKSNFKLDLRPYQKHGLSWMLSREKEHDLLEEIASSNGDVEFSTQSKQNVREGSEGVLNPLWRRYKWPRDMSFQSSQTANQESNEAKYFYANMYNGEMSIEKPLLKSSLRGGILADEMGLGKTISALALVNSVPYDLGDGFTGTNRPYASKTTLIVVPMSLLSQWKSEFDKANNNPNHFCHIYYGDSTETDLSQILVNNTSKDVPVVLLTTYGTIQNEYNRLAKQRESDGRLPAIGIYSVNYFRVILDEGHNIRNRNTKTAKSVYELSSSRRWILTGTPIINRLDDLYSLVKFLELDPWNNFSYWKTFVTLPFEQKKISQTLEVIKSILEPIFFRRTKNMKSKDGKPLVELPEKEVIIEEIKFNEKEEKLYNWLKARASRSFKEGLKTGQVLKQYSQILTHILRLRQVCCHVDLIGSSKEMEEEAIEETKDEEMKSFLQEIMKSKTDGFENETKMKEVMYSLYPKVDLKESECSICTQSPIPLGEMVVTPCGHQFCLTCLLEHIDFQDSVRSKFCPNCRNPISKYRLFKLRGRDTSHNEVRFHSRDEIESRDYKFQLYLYDPDKTSSKNQALITHLRHLKEQCPGQKVIVFSQFSSYLDILENELKIQGGNDFTIYKFDGRLHMQDRQKVLEKFNENSRNDKITILLLSLKAGGVGLNLTTASRAFMMDPWWSPSVEDQAIDRIHRIGQNETVKVIRFIMANSIETKMLKIQERKKQIGEVVGAEEEERRKRRIEEIQILFEE